MNRSVTRVSLGLAIGATALVTVSMTWNALDYNNRLRQNAAAAGYVAVLTAWAQTNCHFVAKKAFVQDLDMAQRLDRVEFDRGGWLAIQDITKLSPMDTDDLCEAMSGAK